MVRLVLNMRSFFQLCCWTSLTVITLVGICDGFVFDYGSQYRKMADPLPLMSSWASSFGYRKFSGSAASVSIDSNGEVVATTEQFSNAGSTEETATVIAGENGVTVVNNETYENVGTVVVRSDGEGGSATVVVAPTKKPLPTNEEQPVVTNPTEEEVAVQAEPVEVLESNPPPATQPTEETVKGEQVIEDQGNTEMVEEPAATVSEEIVRDLEIEFRHVPGVVCHYQVASLFTYNPAYVVKPEQVSLHYCNTLVVSYAILNYETFTIQAYSLEEEAIFLRLTERKTITSKVILEFETMAFYENLENLLTSIDNIRTFATSVVSFLLAFAFDGLQLPALIPNNMDNPNADYSYIKQGYLSLVQELSGIFYENDLSLSVAVPRQPEFINMGYDLVEMVNHVDWFYLVSLDYNNNDASGYLRYTAPLTAQTFNDISYVDFSVNFLLRELQIPSHLIVMALPFYGSTFMLADPSMRNFGAEYVDIGPPGPGAHIKGILTIAELCSLKNTDWLNDDRIITDYEDVPDLVLKVLYARMKQLGGVGVMSVTMEDATGYLCNLGPMPFLSVVYRSFYANSLFFTQNMLSLVDYIDPYTTSKYFD